MQAYERLLRYVAVRTASDENAPCTPSTPCQFDLAQLLADEMKDLGLTQVHVDEHAYVYGTLPATKGLEPLPAVALNAHLDTISDFAEAPVCPLLHPNYAGGPVPLGDSGLTLSPDTFPDLANAQGQLLITTDGRTELGADDKAGIAEILTACERLLASGEAHRRIEVCFSPDEEIGHGADLMDLSRLNAAFGYTVDGDDVWVLNCETFNAAAAQWIFHGTSVHPGSAKGIMVNASLVAMEMDAMLPKGQTPADTEGYEGFFHLTDMKGSVEEAELDYIIRDHDAQRFEERKAEMRRIENSINQKYGAGTAVLTLKEQYRNMREVFDRQPQAVQRAEKVIRQICGKCVFDPIRGGTDGSNLSFKGLPCPNLGTGGHGFHGPYEHITAEAMEQVVEVLLGLMTEED